MTGEKVSQSFKRPVERELFDVVVTCDYQILSGECDLAQKYTNIHLHHESCG